MQSFDEEASSSDSIGSSSSSIDGGGITSFCLFSLDVPRDGVGLVVGVAVTSLTAVAVVRLSSILLSFVDPAANRLLLLADMTSFPPAVLNVMVVAAVAGEAG